MKKKIIIALFLTVLISACNQEEVNPPSKDAIELGCINTGGNPNTQFPNGCQDFCSSTVEWERECTDEITYGCDCGENKCWDGNNCIPNVEKYCENDNDCISSCGSTSGFTCTGARSYNNNYLKSYYKSNNTIEFDGSIDNACCDCDCADGAFVSKCVDDICTTQLVS